MQTCTQCGGRSSDTAAECNHCGADLARYSESSVALSRLQQNPRVGTVRVIPHQDCCPACRAVEGEWPKDQVPQLPVTGCSHPLGCRCFYEPRLLEMYP